MALSKYKTDNFWGGGQRHFLTFLFSSLDCYHVWDYYKNPKGPKNLTAGICAIEVHDNLRSQFTFLNQDKLTGDEIAPIAIIQNG